MGRSALRLRASVRFYQLRCDGAFLACRQRIWLRVSIFGREWNSKRSLPTFPFIINQCCEVQRLCTNAWNLAAMADILSSDGVTVELIQHSKTKPDGHVLARYDTSVQDFLFPKRSAGSIHYVTMKQTGHLKAYVQLSYSTQTAVEEVPLTRPRHSHSWHLDSQQGEQTVETSHQRAPHIIHSTPLHSHSAAQRQTPTNQSLLTPQPQPNTLQSSFPSSADRQLHPFPTTRTGLWVHLSPSDRARKKGRKPRVQFLDDTALMLKDRPPFVVRRVDPDLMTSKGYLSDHVEEATETLGYQPERRHALFDASFGKPSVTVIKHSPPTPTRATLSTEHKETQTRARADYGNRRPPAEDVAMVRSVLDSDSGSEVETSGLSQSVGVKHPVCQERDETETETETNDESEDEMRSLPSAGKWRHRPDWYNTHKYQPSYKRSRSMTHGQFIGSESHPDRRDVRDDSVDPAEKIHKKIDHLLRKYRWKPAHVSGNSSDEDELETTLRRINSRRSDRSQRHHNRSVTVHLGGEDYWSSRMKEWTGRPHRLLFDETLEKAYSRLYKRATDIK